MNDLISRQAAIEALYDWSEHSMTNAEAWHIRQVIGDIKSLPSAQPERMRGKWINRSLNTLYPEWERYTCSVCGKHSNSYDFCPNCGAKMDLKK